MNHGQLLREESEDASIADVAAILDDPKKAKILDAGDRAMLAFSEKLTSKPERLREADIERLRKAGFSEDNIVDIVAGAAYRNFANRVNFALGYVVSNPKGPRELKAAISRFKKRKK